jgi:hypothetical protein
MITSRIPAVLALALVSVAALGSSCTAILAPRDDVQRCGTADDCEPTGDNRYVPVCSFGEGDDDLESLEVDKICVADFKPSVSCRVESIVDPEHPYRATFDELADSARYASCDAATQLGTRGCPPSGGTCNEGLAVEDATGLCDDTDESTPMVVQVETEEQYGQDVRDQFCRSYFCDERFVCDTTSPNSQVCVLCDPSDPFGKGGCSEVWIAGARSCVYDDGGECEGPDVTDEKVTFGACG